MRRVILTCGLLALACCGDDNSSSSDPPLSESDAGPAEECPPDTVPFAAEPSNGSQVSDPATGVSVRITEANYAPPAKDFNDWKIAVTDANGAPLPNAQLTFACAYMPQHMHGSNPKNVVKLGNGQFSLEDQNLSMYGGWEVRLWVNADGSGADYMPKAGSRGFDRDSCRAPDPKAGLANIVFKVCVPIER